MDFPRIPKGKSPFSYLYGAIWRGAQPSSGDNSCPVCYSCRTVFTAAAGAVAANTAMVASFVAPPLAFAAMAFAAWMNYETYYAISQTARVHNEKYSPEDKKEDRTQLKEEAMLGSWASLTAGQALIGAAFVLPALMTGFDPGIAFQVGAVVAGSLLSFGAPFVAALTNRDRIRDVNHDHQYSCWNNIMNDVKQWGRFWPKPAPSTAPA